MKENTLLKGITKIVDKNDFNILINSNKKLRIKWGIDPTKPDLTLGHFIILKKLKEFQDLGHKIIIIIGDYTAMIGDPSGRSFMRPIISNEEIQYNYKTYINQIFKVLDSNSTEIHFNSEWLKKLNFEDLLIFFRKITVSKLLERNDFENRFKNKKPISIIEFLYPIIQGYDSIMVKSDIEIGGNDQLFNLIIGRILQKLVKESKQVAICMPLLKGLDGNYKMSKSYNNYISFNDTPNNMFGKVMSISDDLMFHYYEIIENLSNKEIKEIKINLHPMEAKKQLAYKIVSYFYSQKIAEDSYNEFVKIFSQKNNPSNILTFIWDKLNLNEEAYIIDILKYSKIFDSTKHIKRLFKDGAIKVNDKKIDNPFFKIKKPSFNNYIIIKTGKKNFIKILSN